MKRVIFTLTFILIAIYLLLSILGMNSEYVAEKSFWKVTKKYDSLMRDPALIPELTYNDLISRYEKFLARFPSSKLIPSARMYIGRIGISKKDYQSARNIFEKVIIDYPDNKVIGMQAVAGIGNSYVLEEDYNSAISTYDRIINQYPLSDLGLKSPLLKLRYLAKFKTRNEMEQAYKDVFDYYDSLAVNNKGTEIEYKALKMKASFYLEREMFREAVNIFGEILIKFSSSKYLSAQQLGNLIKSINTVSLTQLKEVDLPVSIYSEFVNVYPQHSYAELLKEIIKNLNDIKGSAAKADDSDE